MCIRTALQNATQYSKPQESCSKSKREKARLVPQRTSHRATSAPPPRHRPPFHATAPPPGSKEPQQCLPQPRSSRSRTATRCKREKPPREKSKAQAQRLPPTASAALHGPLRPPFSCHRHKPGLKRSVSLSPTCLCTLKKSLSAGRPGRGAQSGRGMHSPAQPKPAPARFAALPRPSFHHHSHAAGLKRTAAHFAAALCHWQAHHRPNTYRKREKTAGAASLPPPQSAPLPAPLAQKRRHFLRVNFLQGVQPPVPPPLPEYGARSPKSATVIPPY